MQHSTPGAHLLRGAGSATLMTENMKLHVLKSSTTVLDVQSPVRHGTTAGVGGGTRWGQLGPRPSVLQLGQLGRVDANRLHIKEDKVNLRELRTDSR